MTRSFLWRITDTITRRLPNSAQRMMKPMTVALMSSRSTCSKWCQFCCHRWSVAFWPVSMSRSKGVLLSLVVSKSRLALPDMLCGQVSHRGVIWLGCSALKHREKLTCVRIHRRILWIPSLVPKLNPTSTLGLLSTDLSSLSIGQQSSGRNQYGFQISWYLQLQ